jgi:hypothetical protein
MLAGKWIDANFNEMLRKELERNNSTGSEDGELDINPTCCGLRVRTNGVVHYATRNNCHVRVLSVAGRRVTAAIRA